MKKTLLALSIAALAANSANALTVIDNQETGTKIDFSGSVRLAWQSTSNTGRADQHINEAIVNNGSRFGFKVTQDLAEGFYALGRIEWRSRGMDVHGQSSSQHDFDHLYVRQAYAGIGHKQLGELTYGNQTTITDEVKQTDLPNKLSLSDGLLDFAARRSIQYVYNGIEGLRIGAYYAGDSKRNDANRNLTQERDSEYGAGATYRWKLDDNQSIKFGAGFSRENYKENATSLAYNRVAYAFGTAYTFGKTTIGVDLEQAKFENSADITTRKQKEVRTVLFHRLTNDVNVYGMYAHKTDERSNKKQINNQYMIGSEYWIARDALKQYNLRAKTFLEWQTSQIRNGHSYNKAKVRDNRTVIGFRVYW